MDCHVSESSSVGPRHWFCSAPERDSRTLESQCVEDAQVAREICYDMAVITVSELEHLLRSSQPNKNIFNTRQCKTTRLGMRSAGSVWREIGFWKEIAL